MYKYCTHSTSRLPSVTATLPSSWRGVRIEAAQPHNQLRTTRNRTRTTSTRFGHARECLVKQRWLLMITALKCMRAG